MHTNRSVRPFVIGTPVSRTMFAIIRVLIGSYFLAAGTGLILEPSSRTFFDAVLPSQPSLVATTAYLFITGFMIMVGKAVRPAALLLSIYIFWSAFVHFETAATPGALTQFWNDMALLGAVLLVAVTEPGGSESFHLWRKGRAISPRRITPNRDGLSPAAAATGRPQRVQPQMQRAAQEPTLQMAKADGCDEDEDRAFNIFGDAWDNAATPAFASRSAANS